MIIDSAKSLFVNKTQINMVNFSIYIQCEMREASVAVVSLIATEGAELRSLPWP